MLVCSILAIELLIRWMNGSTGHGKSDRVGKGYEIWAVGGYSYFPECRINKCVCVWGGGGGGGGGGGT